VHLYGGESPTDPNAAYYKKPESKIDDNSVSVKYDLEEQLIVQLLVGRVGSNPTGP
jgi:hypothetical protein